SSTDLTLQLPYTTGTYTLYLPELGPRISTNSLAVGQPAQLGGQSYQPYIASNLAKSTVVPVELTGLGNAGSTSSQLALISLGVVLLVLGGGVLLFTLRRPVAAARAGRGDPEALEQERLQLLVRLASLDDRF